MKGIILFVLVTATVALYLGYGPYDLVLLFQPTTSAPAVKRAHAAAEQATEQTPVPQNTSIIVAAGPDGSLEQRWPKAVATSTPSPVKQ
jgi:hypothetical protein